MYYDITNPDKAYKWLYSILNVKQGELIDEYVLKCGNDFDRFFELHIKEIEEMDLNKLEIATFHVTSNNDECLEIKKNGLKNLQRVLDEDTGLSKFLLEKDIKFDIENKKMYVSKKEFDINYKRLKEIKYPTKEEKDLKNIAHKIYYDFQINGFFFNRDIYDYGTEIHRHPEFLYTLSSFSEETIDIAKSWDEMNQGYVIKYKSFIKDFDYYTFYNDKEEYLNDYYSRWMKLKYWLISQAVDCCFSNIASEVFAYMKPYIVITPERILECVPVEEWRDNVTKYFK